MARSRSPLARWALPRLLRAVAISAVQPPIARSGEKALPLFSHRVALCDCWAGAGAATSSAPRAKPTVVTYRIALPIAVPRGCKHFYKVGRRLSGESAAKSLEDAIAFQVDDLLGLRDRERNRAVPAWMHVGAQEAVFSHPLWAILLDDAGRLVVAVRSVGGRLDAVALVVDRRYGRFGFAGSSRARQAGPDSFEFREHRSASSVYG